jgi:hypothetical protein
VTGDRKELRTARLFLILAAMNVTGWILVSVFWADEVLWRVGGLMVYASVAGLFATAVWAAIRTVWRLSRR